MRSASRMTGSVTTHVLTDFRGKNKRREIGPIDEIFMSVGTTAQKEGLRLAVGAGSAICENF
jgi:hypothetical protein